MYSPGTTTHLMRAIGSADRDLAGPAYAGANLGPPVLSKAFSGLVKTEATTVGWIFLKKIHFRGCREVHTIPENALISG